MIFGKSNPIQFANNLIKSFLIFKGFCQEIYLFGSSKMGDRSIWAGGWKKKLSTGRGRWILNGLLLAYGLAGFGLVFRLAIASSLSTRLMVMALLLFGFDLTHMAWVDLDRWFLARSRMDHPRLREFLMCLGVTIAIELVGLYVSWWGLGVGMGAVMVSQVWFNGSVRWGLHPHKTPPIRPWPLSERFPVLMADCVALGLTVGWMLGGQPVWIAIVLLSMTAIYLGIKYVPTGLKSIVNEVES